MSSIIYEVLDMGTGILDDRGELACSGAGIPAFVGVLDKAVRVIIERAKGEVRPGDVFGHQRPLLRRRHASERHHRGDAGVRGRHADRLDGQHRP
jgi:N-methylhydantoinase B/oxoprolinase/acetone carboxylase alpha subunit